MPIDELMPFTWFVTLPDPFFVWLLIRPLTLSETPLPLFELELPEMIPW